MCDFLKIKDFKLKGKLVLARVDMNSPIDPMSGEFLNIRRVIGSSRTLKALSDKGAKVVVLAHQGRPGEEYDFTTMQTHAQELSKILGKKVRYIDDIFGTYAKEEIKKLKDGEILLLENIRFYSEELLDRPADSQLKCHLVHELSGLFDYYVNDAFATAHRSQPSLVGFAYQLPAMAGVTMEEELEVLGKVLKSPKKSTIFMLGGTKAKDSMKVIDKALTNGYADKILTSGLVALIFLAAKGYDLGTPTKEFMRGKGLDKLVPYGQELLKQFEDHIELPTDLAVNKQGSRVEVSLGELPLPYVISDIGSGTIGRYAYIISQAKTILANGPAGYIENDVFAQGTNALVEAMSKSKAFTVIGGGHLAVNAEKLGLQKKIDHISTGGGACILFLAGERLPVINALKYSAKKFKEGKKKK